jgi:hypothetical protein
MGWKWESNSKINVSTGCLLLRGPQHEENVSGTKGFKYQTHIIVGGERASIPPKVLRLGNSSSSANNTTTEKEKPPRPRLKAFQ